MALKINEVKKHLEQGDLLEVQSTLEKMGKSVSYKHISAVLNGRKKTPSVIAALIAKAESNIAEKEQLKEQVDSLKKRSKNL